MSDELEQRLTFIEITGKKSSDGHLIALYKCACGNQVEALRSRVKNGYTRSCGCLASDTKPNLRHGMRNSPEYSSWQSMKGRCLDHSNKDYPRWGGRGVTVCKEWIDSFEAFFSHIGPRPPGTSLDRIDNNRGYEPGNVRWATASEQMQNTRAAYQWHIKGHTFPTVYAAAKHFGVSAHSVWRWVNGQYDKRRRKFTAPREDCYATRRY